LVLAAGVLTGVVGTGFVIARLAKDPAGQPQVLADATDPHQANIRPNVEVSRAANLTSATKKTTPQKSRD
jgi:hypothetical protein